MEVAFKSNMEKSVCDTSSTMTSAVLAMTVAERGFPSSRDISPKKLPS